MILGSVATASGPGTSLHFFVGLPETHDEIPDLQPGKKNTWLIKPLKIQQWHNPILFC